MFTEFFYLLRQAYGLNLSLPEWQTLLRGLEAGLHRNSLLGFYELCRLTLAKSESDLDKLDRGFLDYFGDIDLLESVPEAFMEWLAHPEVQDNSVYNFKLAEANDAYSNNEVSQMFRERLRTQKEEHNRGNFYVGTSGVSPFGRNGYSPKGVRVGGEGRFRRAFAVAQRREFRDFREDQVLDLRQMQIAFRRLRQYSGREDVLETEFALDKTIHATCQNGGCLRVVYEKPRKNTIKLALLMDSGGSMYHYGRLCSTLFHAANQANHWKDFKLFYFHNCVYDQLYTDPRCQDQSAIATEQVLRQLTPDYRLMFVGDAQMNPDELLRTSYFSFSRYGVNKTPGIQWLKRFKDRYPHLVWVNPEGRPSGGKFWTTSYDAISDLFGGMYQLTLEGLNEALKTLLAKA